MLYLLETEPGISQRDIARRLGISVGRVNYCLKALFEKGAVKVANFRASEVKWRYAYVLTPSGVARRTRMTGRFLKRKLAEYERLKAQIETLQGDMTRNVHDGGDVEDRALQSRQGKGKEK